MIISYLLFHICNDNSLNVLWGLNKVLKKGNLILYYCKNKKFLFLAFKIDSKLANSIFIGFN